MYFFKEEGEEERFPESLVSWGVVFRPKFFLPSSSHVKFDKNDCRASGEQRSGEQARINKIGESQVDKRERERERTPSIFASLLGAEAG